MHACLEYFLLIKETLDKMQERIELAQWDNEGDASMAKKLKEATWLLDITYINANYLIKFWRIKQINAYIILFANLKLKKRMQILKYKKIC